MRTQLRVAVFVVASLVQTGTTQAQTTYSWNNTRSDWGNPGSWYEGAVPNDLNLARVEFAARASPNSPNIGNNTYSVLGIRFDNSSGVGWDLKGGTGSLNLGAEGITWVGGNSSTITANLRIAQNQTWDLGTTNVKMSSPLSGYGTLTKTGSGTLHFNQPNANVSTFFGTYNVAEGTLLLDEATTNPSQHVLRSNTLHLAEGTLLTSNSNPGFLRTGSLSGSGTIGGNNFNNLMLHSLSDSTFSGSIKAPGSVFNVRGANGTTQTLNGNVTGIKGNLSVNSGATLRLSGTGDSVSGVLGSKSVELRGGGLVLDNSSGNTSATQGRLADTVSVAANGGLLSLIGHQSGSVETFNALTLNGSMSTLSVTNNGGSATMAFQSFTNVGTGTVDFVGKGIGTLGAAGDAPQITFATAPGLTNGVIASASDSPVLGFATVNGSDFAGYGPNGVVAVNSTAVSGNLIAAPTMNAVLTDNSATLGASQVTYNTLKIAPGGSGYTLDLTDTGSLSTAGILLTGTHDFTIRNTGSGTGGLIADAQRYITVSNPDTTLFVGVNLASGTNGLTKSGEGILALTGETNQFNVTGPTNISLAGGVLRSSLESLGGGGATEGKNTTIQLRCGVLEIQGGGDLYRALDLTGTTSGGGITFDQTNTDRGQGGFSAIDGNARVTLTTALGGTTNQLLAWNDGRFLNDGMALVMGSTRSNNRIELTNPLHLDLVGLATNYTAREIRVIDNPNSTTDLTRLSGIITGKAQSDLLKTGQGTLELAGNNTYAGNTLVSQGTLRASNSTSSTGTSQIIVMSGAQLEGRGKINGRTVIAAGGTIRGGFADPDWNNNARGALTLGNTDLFGGPGITGATLAVDLNGNASPTTNLGQNSTLAMGSNVLNLDTTAGKVNIRLLNDAALLPNQSYTMTLATGSAGSFYRNGSLATGDNTYRLSDFNLISGSGLYSFSLTNDSLRLDGTGQNLILSFTPVPEPTTVLAIGAVGLVLFGWMRRRRHTDGTLSLPG